MDIVEYYNSQGVKPHKVWEEVEANLEEASRFRNSLVMSMFRRFVISTAFVALACAYLYEREDALPVYLVLILLLSPVSVLILLIDDIGPLIEHNRKTRKLRADERYWRG